MLAKKRNTAETTMQFLFVRNTSTTVTNENIIEKLFFRSKKSVVRMTKKKDNG